MSECYSFFSFSCFKHNLKNPRGERMAFIYISCLPYYFFFSGVWRFLLLSFFTTSYSSTTGLLFVLLHLEIYQFPFILREYFSWILVFSAWLWHVTEYELHGGFFSAVHRVFSSLYKSGVLFCTLISRAWVWVSLRESPNLFYISATQKILPIFHCLDETFLIVSSYSQLLNKTFFCDGCFKIWDNLNVFVTQHRHLLTVFLLQFDVTLILGILSDWSWNLNIFEYNVMRLWLSTRTLLELISTSSQDAGYKINIWNQWTFYKLITTCWES